MVENVANVRSLDLLPFKIITPSCTKNYPPSSLSNRLLELLSYLSQWFQTPCPGLQTEFTV